MIGVNSALGLCFFGIEPCVDIDFCRASHAVELSTQRLRASECKTCKRAASFEVYDLLQSLELLGYSEWFYTPMRQDAVIELEVLQGDTFQLSQTAGLLVFCISCVATTPCSKLGLSVPCLVGGHRWSKPQLYQFLVWEHACC